MPNQRKTPRSASKLEAKAVLSGRADVACTISDLSATGARLSFRHPTILPRQFNLRFGSRTIGRPSCGRRGSSPA